MLRFLKEKNFLNPLLIWFMVLLWYLVFAHKLFHTPEIKLNNIISSHSFWFYYQPPKQTKEITIVAIDEASRRKLNLQWPWKRSITAKLINNIVSLSPKVIGLDIVFSGKSKIEDDKQLVNAIKSHPKVVLGYKLNKYSYEKSIQGLIDVASSMGFVNKPLDDGIVTKLNTFFKDSNKKTHFSLEIEILRNYLGMDSNEVKVRENGLLFKDNFFIPSPGGTTTLNYLVYPSHFRTIPAHLVLENKVNAEDFKDKIILIGATDPLIHDEYSTPVEIFPGITIIGNSLIMILSNRFVQNSSAGQNYLFIFLLGSSILLINKKFDFIISSVSTIILLCLTYFSFIYFRSQDIVFSYFAILFSGVMAYSAFNLHKYLNLIYISNRLKNQAIIDPLTGLYYPRFFLLQLDNHLNLNKNIAFIGLRIVNYQRLSRNLKFEQIKLLIKFLSEHLRSNVKKAFKKVHFSCISDDTFGIDIEGETKDKVKNFLENIIKTSKSTEWDLNGEKIISSLKAGLIFKHRESELTNFNAIQQMENILKNIKEGQICAENLKEFTKRDEKKVDYRDILDFIAYDWEEKNKDLEKSLKEILEANKRLDQLGWGALTALARTIDAKSPWTAGHSERVTQVAVKIGRVLNLSEDALDNLSRAGFLHDIGKIGTPREILDKPGKLTKEEYQIIREHPGKGAIILEPIDAFTKVIPMVEQHHEWFNGKGYPKGLEGEEISFGGRILSVADIFDALKSGRPYRAGMSLEKVIDIIKEGSGLQFDPMVVDAFVHVMDQEKEQEEKLPIPIQKFYSKRKPSRTKVRDDIKYHK